MCGQPTTLPPQNESHKSDVKPPVKPQIHRSEIAGEPARTPQPQPQRTVNARELINVIVAAWMSDDRDRVTIEVRGSSIVIEQVMDENGQRTKTIWDIGIQHYHVSSQKLIK
jgi:hypothetical protein